jgi:hypothetical protein
VGAITDGRFTSERTGTAVVTVTVGGKSVSAGTITVVPGPVASVTVDSPVRVTGGEPAQFTATVRDRFGNAVRFAGLTWTATGGAVTEGGLFAGAAAATAAGDIRGSTEFSIAPPQERPAPPGIYTDAEVVRATTPTDSGTEVVYPPVIIQGSGPVQISIDLPVGRLPDPTLLVYYYDAHLSAWIAVPTSFADGQATAQVPAGKPVALLRGMIRQAPDAAGHWANASLLKLQSIGLLNGFPDATIRPNDTATRYQMAKVLALALRLDVVHADLSVLQRLPDGDLIPEWVKPYVAAVVFSGVMQGGDAGFQGGALVTRAQMATLLGRILGQGDTARLNFSDMGAIPGWAQEGVSRSVAAGLISGFPDGTFRPDEPLTRAQMARILGLLMDLLPPR